MAGLASRFVNEGITTPKPLIVVNGKTLIEHTLETLNLEGSYIFVTRRYEDPDDNVDLSAMLQKLRPGSREICLGKPTRGAVETCLAAKEWIDNDESLVITNCDQRTEWDSKAFLAHVSPPDIDGTIVTHESSDPKHSYADIRYSDSLNHAVAKRIVEKQVISDQALVGIHYWRQGRLFVGEGEVALITRAFDGKKECYVSETYNNLISRGFTITAFQIGQNEYIPLGTPYDVALYEAKAKEYLTEKPKTLFIDLDGTILRHLHRFSAIPLYAPDLLKGVVEKIDAWDSAGHRIILCTARKESARKMTEKHLRSLGLCWDQLVMGLTSGPRILINDKLTAAAKDRAVSVNLLTDQGFEDTDWGALGL